MLLKGASNVPGCSQAIAHCSHPSTFQLACTNLPIHASEVERVIANPLVRGVTLTGVKPPAARLRQWLALISSVLELGGQDPYIVWLTLTLPCSAKVRAKPDALLWPSLYGCPNG